MDAILGHYFGFDDGGRRQNIAPGSIGIQPLAKRRSRRLFDLVSMSIAKERPVTLKQEHGALLLAPARRHEPYGIVAVFEDLYGNRWDLIGPVTGMR